MKNRDFVVGMILSFACEGAATVKREPTAYSYNGVVLPKLPEWDRETYPYAVVYYPGWFDYMFFASKEPWHGTGEMYMYDGKQFGEAIENNSDGLFRICGQGVDDSWRLLTAEDYENEYDDEYGKFIYERRRLGLNKDNDCDGDFDFGAMGLIQWTNHDIIGADGTVLFAASEPIPIYE